MILSKLFPKPNKRGAVFASLGLIFLGMVVARILPEELPDDRAYLGYIIAAGFLLLSWDMVNDIVGGAIDDAAERISETKAEIKAEKRIDECESKLREYREKNTPEGIFRRQEQEYRLIILCARHPQDYELRIIEDPFLKDDGTTILACESIIRGLAVQDIFLRAMATRACQHVLVKEEATQKELEEDPSFLNFRKDIYIYLRTWLMLSIKNNREMDIFTILKVSSNEEVPDVTAHVQALSFIRDYLIDDELLNEYLEPRYRNAARGILKNRLSKLVDLLTTISDQRALKTSQK